MGAMFLAAAEALAQDGEESQRRIVVSISDRRLTVFEDGRLVKIYPTAVGADATPSPTGVFKIANRVKNPTWYGPKGLVVQPGKSNPLGDRWMGLTRKGYGIHGTPDPSKVGKSESHGCVRLTNWDALRLAAGITKGTPVDFSGQEQVASESRRKR